MFNSDTIQRFQSIPTPFYYYDLSVLKNTLELVSTESSRYHFKVHYALKANANDKLLALIKSYGLGADCVSGNEVRKAAEIGFNSGDIVFAGVGKSDDEINLALDRHIACFNCESLQELGVIDTLARAKQQLAGVALRINPNVDANTHKYITTGLEENKFGINLWELESVVEAMKQMPNLHLEGLHFHIGSQITDLNTFRNLCRRINDIQQWFEHRQMKVGTINVGGGLGIDYHAPDENPYADFAAYFKVFNDFLELRPQQQLHFELGRAIVAQCGTLISKVLYIKKGINTNFAILDAGMTDLLRPALYQAYHKIEKLTPSPASAPVLVYDVVGPVCESSDCFGKAVDLPETARGDLMALRSTGAYGEVMSSGYNLRDKALVVYSDSL